jgi:hypothetical protein
MATSTLSLILRRFVAATTAVIAVAAFSGATNGFRALVDVGVPGPFYGTAVTPAVTGEKPQSKLWWTDGSWWGYLFSASAQRYHIFRLNEQTQTWIDTGIAVDDRVGSKADVLWHESSQRLYVAANSYSSSAQATSTVSKWARLYRFTYSAAADSYTLDTGFPVNISRATAEALTLARDSAGRLWATWVQNSTVMISHSTTSDLQWSTPFTLPAQGTSVSSDDVSAVIAFGGDRIGVMWSNQVTDITYFAVHRDADAPTAWQGAEAVIPGPGCSGLCADDHINLKTDSQGRVFAALKTSLSGGSSPLTMLAVRATGGGWTAHTFGLKSDQHTRPIVVLDEQNARIYMIATAPEAGGTIYYKWSPLGSISFPSGTGTALIGSSADSDISNATSAKANATAASGVVVLASSEATRRYYHNVITVGGAAITGFSPLSGAPGTLVTITGVGLAGSTEVRFNQAPAAYTVVSDTQVRATVPGGATSGRIVVTTPSGQVSSAGDFVVTLPPTVSSFSPDSGPVGTMVTISGSNFSGATQVTFGGTPAAFSIISASSISASVPSGAVTGRIRVTTPSGSDDSSTDFTVTTGGGGGNRLRDVTFEGGALVNPITGVDRINGSVALETGMPLHGAYSARVPGTGDSYLEVSFPSSDDVYVSMEFMILALPASEVRLLQISNSGTTVGNILLTPSGTLKLRVGSTNIGVVSGALSVGQRWRIGLRQRRGSGGNGVLEAFVAAGDTLFGAPFASTSTGTWTTPADRLRLGATTPAALNGLLDNLRIDAAAMPPPGRP